MWACVPAPSILLGNVGLGSMVLYPQGVESQKVLTEMQTTAWLGIQGGGTYSDPYASVRSLRLECINVRFKNTDGQTEKCPQQEKSDIIYVIPPVDGA